MAISTLAGKPAPKNLLVDLARLEREYYERRPDLADPNQLVSFGTSGHRGSSLRGTFNEAHILAITQAICDYRRGQGIDGPLYHGQGHARAVRAGAAHRARSAGRQRRRDGHPAQATASRRRRSSRAPSSSTTAAAQAASPTASSSRRRTIRRRTAASSTTRPTAARPTPTSREWVQDRANELLRERQRRSEARAVRSRHQGRDHAPGRLHPALRRRSAERRRHGRDPRRRAQAGGRSARRRGAAILGADQCHLRTEHHRRQSR